MPPVSEVADPWGSSALRERVAREIEGWIARPLVWRDDGRTVQAVLLGVFRFTWSRAHPTGVLDMFDLLDGWRQVDQNAVFMVPSAMVGVSVCSLLRVLGVNPRPNANVTCRDAQRWVLFVGMVNAVIQQNAREHQAQQGDRRGTLWRHPDHPAERSWCPALGPLLDQGTHHPLMMAVLPDAWKTLWTTSAELVDPAFFTRGPGDAAMRNARVELVRLVRALNAHSPLWGCLRRTATWWNGPLDNQGLEWVFHCFSRMEDWEARLREHPNADLLLPLATALPMAPGQHLWREDVWVPTQLPTPQAWRFALQNGPRASVRTLLRRLPVENVLPDRAYPQRVLGAFAALPEAAHPIPVAVLRSIPMNLWCALADRSMTDDDEAEALLLWRHEVVRAFLRAAQRRPWTNQQVPFSTWLQTCEPVWDWVLLRTSSPFQDPSWTWNTLMDLATVQPDVYEVQWPALLRAGRVDGVTLTPVTSEAQWRAMGVLMQNCLKDYRSDHYLSAVRQRKAFLYRLDDQRQRSVLVIAQDESSGAWQVAEHRGMANSVPSPEHMGFAKKLGMFHDHRLRPAPRSWGQRLGGLIGRARPSGTGPAPKDQPWIHGMNALLDPAWALERARRWRRYLPHVLMRQVWNAWLLVWQDGMLEDPPLKRCQEVLGAGVVLWLVGVGVAIALETVAYVLS